MTDDEARGDTDDAGTVEAGGSSAGSGGSMGSGGSGGSTIAVIPDAAPPDVGGVCGNILTDVTRRLDSEGGALCEWDLPEAPPGETIDWSRVNFQIAHGNGTTELLYWVADLDACGDAAGWFYLGAQSPSGVGLCPASCTAIDESPGATLQALIGCPTESRS